MGFRILLVFHPPAAFPCQADLSLLPAQDLLSLTVEMASQVDHSINGPAIQAETLIADRTADTITTVTIAARGAAGTDMLRAMYTPIRTSSILASTTGVQLTILKMSSKDRTQIFPPDKGLITARMRPLRDTPIHIRRSR